MATYALKPLDVYLREAQLEDLQALADQDGVHGADLIRRGVGMLLADERAPLPKTIPPQGFHQWAVTESEKERTKIVADPQSDHI